MEENLADRRIRRTKDRIRQALIKLLLEKDLQDITVSELTERADVNRGTFYLHYKDVSDLLHQIEAEVVEEFTRYIVKYKNHAGLLRMPILGDLFKYIAMNEEVCRALLRSSGANFLDRIIIHSRPGSAAEFQRQYEHWDGENAGYYFDFICHGSIAMLRHWLEGGMPESVEQITRMADKMISHCENIK